MIQAQTQTAEYWGAQFDLTNSDTEQIYNHFLEVERPQTIAQITKTVMAHRIQEEVQSVQRMMHGRAIYQPQNSYEVGDDLVFPALQFAQGTVTAVRDGFNPEDGQFNVLAVDIQGKSREFAASYTLHHVLNNSEANDISHLTDVDIDQIVGQYGNQVEGKIAAALAEQPDFVLLTGVWFTKSLLLDINIGHLHLSEAVLEISGGGPLTPGEIVPHLDLDPNVDETVQYFSLNYALHNDERFDEVAPEGEVSWFLRRLEPEGVQTVPPRLVNRASTYDHALLSQDQRILERELDDEWSELSVSNISQPAVLALTFPHRWAGTLPLSSRLKPLFPSSQRPRQRIVFVDEETQEEIVGWVVKEHLYVYGLKDWYEQNQIPVGGFLHFAPGPRPGVIMMGYDRRRAQREWVRLASVADNRIQFNLERRSIGCGYDDLLIVGTDVLAAIDALWRRAEANQRSVASLLAEIFPSLAELAPQGAVHAKTLYSAINMLKRIPPGQIFAELRRNPAFIAVGDQYWKFDQSRRQND